MTLLVILTDFNSISTARVVMGVVRGGGGGGGGGGGTPQSRVLPNCFIPNCFVYNSEFSLKYFWGVGGTPRVVPPDLGQFIHKSTYPGVVRINKFHQNVSRPC